MYNSNSDYELLRELEVKNYDCPLLKELATRLFQYGEGDETIDDKTDEDYTNACVDNMQEIAGEDYHHEIMNDIRELETIKKMVDRKEHIDYIVNKLNDMDREALDLIETIKSGGVF